MSTAQPSPGPPPWNPRPRNHHNRHPPLPQRKRRSDPGAHKSIDSSYSSGRETSLVLLSGARQARSCCRARDEEVLLPDDGRETSQILLPATRRARSCCQARDESGPAAGRETSSVLLPGARRARSCCRARDEHGPAAGRETSAVLLPEHGTSDGSQQGEGHPTDEDCARASRRGVEALHRPLTNGPTPKKSGRRRETILTTAMSHHHAVAAHIPAEHSPRHLPSPDRPGAGRSTTTRERCSRGSHRSRPPPAASRSPATTRAQST